MEFSKRLQELRQEKGYSVRELSRKLGISHPIILAWEDNVSKPGYAYLIKLAKYFNVSVDYLVGLSDKR